MAKRCNICNLPDYVEYYEKDENTGLMRKKSHKVPCLGHNGIHPAFWNLHPDYYKFNPPKRGKKK